MVQPKILLLALFFIFSFLQLLRITVAENSSVFSLCFNSGNYTKNSVFQTNLQTALSFNAANINHGFYNFSQKWKADRLDAIGLCQGYMKPNSCRSCLDDSSKSLRQSCPNQKEAIGWAENCMIRYANRSILHKNETLPAIYLRNMGNATNPTQFNKAVKSLLDNLRTKAAVGSHTLKYATGKMNSTTPSQKIYGLVQCTPDLSLEQCSNCLNTIVSFLPMFCNGKIGCRFIGPSCNFRYELYNFFDQTPMPNGPGPAPAPAPQVIAPAPPSSNGQIATTPISSPPTSAGFQPPPPPPQGGANRNVAFFSLMVAFPAIFIL